MDPSYKTSVDNTSFDVGCITFFTPMDSYTDPKRHSVSRRGLYLSAVFVKLSLGCLRIDCSDLGSNLKAK